MKLNSWLVLASAVLASCATRGTVQDNPSANQKIIFASAYSAEDCQAEMNTLAGTEVKMVSDSQRLVMSILSLGIQPSHHCVGIAKNPPATSSSSSQHG